MDTNDIIGFVTSTNLGDENLEEKIDSSDDVNDIERTEEIVECKEVDIRNFENSKNQLKIFAESVDSHVSLRKVAEKDRLIKIIDRKVTGEELNQITMDIQKYLIDINGQTNETIRQFNQIYNTFEALDNEYIQKILTSIEATEKVSNDAKDLSLKIQEHTKQLEQAQELQEKTIKQLLKFKEKLDSVEHLSDIDTMWETYSKLQNIEKQKTSKSNLLAISSMFVAVLTLVLNLFGVI